MNEANLDSLIGPLFEFSPVAYSLSTAGHVSRYVRVNQAYLGLVGKSWNELAGQGLRSTGVAIFNTARHRRIQLLDTVGFYSGEEATVRHANGSIRSVLISARRLMISGMPHDLEALTDITDRTTAQRQQEEKLRRAATIDTLTNLQNRSSFEYSLNQMLQERSGETQVAVAMLDLNGFKQINDTLGHAMGDMVLAEVGKRLAENVRGGDIVARLGGDEFGFIFLTKKQAALQLERRVMAALRRVFGVFEIKAHRLQIGAALGLAFAPEVNGSAPDLVSLADSRMYAAKTTRERVAVRGPLPGPDL